MFYIWYASGRFGQVHSHSRNLPVIPYGVGRIGQDRAGSGRFRQVQAGSVGTCLILPGFRPARTCPNLPEPPGATDPHLDRRRARRPSREVRPKSPLFCCVVRASLGAAPRRARCHSAVQSPRRCRPLSGARGVRAVDRPQSATMPFHSPNDERPPRRTSCWCGRRPSRTRRCP